MSVEFDSELSSELSRCLGCGGCNIPCPIFNVEDRVESSGMRSRVKILSMLSRGTIELTEGTLRHIFTCANCGLCNDYCPVGLNPFDLMVVARSSFIDMGYVPLVTVGIRDSFRKSGSPIGEDLIKGNWLPPDFQPKRDSDVLLFAGCWMHRATEVALNVMKILGKASENFTTIGPNEPCSGALLYLLGERDLADESKGRLLSTILDLNPKKVISGCSLTTNMYEGLGFVDLTSYIIDSVKSGRLKLNKYKGKDLSVLPVPSCSNESYLNALIMTLDGVNLVDPPEWLCCDCGFTLMYREERGRFSNWVQKVLFTAGALGANHVVIEDVGCYTMLMDVLETKSRMKGIKISHISSFILEFMR
ncbi:MAG: (Fe-S)-binding protein [Candidatus Korarchaeum sp.]